MSKVLLVPICAWAVTQAIKILIALIRRKRVGLRYFVTGGGMPSSHSATVSALAASVAMVQGFESVTFGIAVILALVVMYDAAGVRRSVGKQSVILNRIVQEIRSRRPEAVIERELWELIGHTPFQVIVGAVLGILVAWLWFTIAAM
jgi:acid phosphatase family membrane protein YuiD